LSGANLQGANLSGANLTGIDLTGIKMLYANLSGANLTGAKLSGVNLSDANLSGANLSGANLTGANLSDANLSRANLQDANLSDANLSRSNLQDAKYDSTTIGLTEEIISFMIDTDTKEEIFIGPDANLSGVNLSGMDLTGIDLTGANLSGANLSGIDLSGIDLSGIDLSGIELSGANLSGANLSGAFLERANLSGANLYRAKYDNTTIGLTEELILQYNMINTDTKEEDDTRISNGTYSAYLDGVSKETGQPEVDGALTYLYFDNMYYVDVSFGPIEFTFNHDDLIVSFGTANYSNSKQFKYNSETQLYEIIKDDGAIDGALDGDLDGALDGAIEGAIEGALDGALDGAIESPFPPNTILIKKQDDDWTFKTEVTFELLKNLNIGVNENQVINSGKLVINKSTKSDVIEIKKSNYVLYHVSPSFKAFNAELKEAKELGYDLIDSNNIKDGENKIGDVDLSVFQEAVQEFEEKYASILDPAFSTTGTDGDGNIYSIPNISIEIPSKEGKYAFNEGTQDTTYNWNDFLIVIDDVDAHQQTLSENDFQFNMYILLQKSN
jgi:uncharacterized protein YjbI with pentapeptide repeats